MWKYILIALFLLLAIREINLMNQSLYIAPDNKIVAEDKTTAAELKKLINKIEHNEFLIKEPETIKETNISAQEKHIAHQPVQSSIPKPVPEQNSTYSPIIHEKTAETNKTSTKPKPLFKSSAPETGFHEVTKQKAEEQPVSIKSAPSDYPENFDRAEEKVRQILKQMKK